MMEARVMLAWARLQFVANNPSATERDRQRAQMRFERAYNAWAYQ